MLCVSCLFLYTFLESNFVFLRLDMLQKPVYTFYSVFFYPPLMKSVKMKTAGDIALSEFPSLLL